MFTNTIRLKFIFLTILAALFLTTQIYQPLTISLEESYNASVSPDKYLDWDRDGEVEVASEEEKSDPVSLSLLLEKFIHQPSLNWFYLTSVQKRFDIYSFPIQIIYKEITEPPKKLKLFLKQ